MTSVEDSTLEHRYRRLYENCAVAIFELDLEGNLVSANPAMVALFEYATEEEFLKANASGSLFVDAADRDQWFATLRRDGRVSNHQKAMRTRTGRRVELQDTTYLIHDEYGKPVAYQGTATDVSTIIELNRKLAHDAYEDNLTGLPNRTAIERMLKRILKTIEAKSDTHALFYFDIDQFRIVNDTLGHDAGDELLRQLAGDLAARIPKTVTLARVGGDEFVLLLRKKNVEQVTIIANNLLKRIRAFRFDWRGNSVEVTASIGVALIESSAQSVQEVFGAADAACYTAKEKGRNRVHIQERNDQTVSRRISQMRTVIELKHALQENRLVLYRQPIEPLQPRHFGQRGFELLVRMQDSDGLLICTQN